MAPDKETASNEKDHAKVLGELGLTRQEEDRRPQRGSPQGRTNAMWWVIHPVPGDFGRVRGAKEQDREPCCFG